MRILLKAPILLLAALLTMHAGATIAADKDPLLTNIQGGQQRLSDYLGKGKWVLFNVWGPKCPPCLEEVAELVSFHDDHQDKDAIVVSLALDFPSFGYAKAGEVKTFIDEYFVNFTVLLGDAELAQQATGERLLGTPSTYLYDPAGKLAAVQVGTVTQEIVEDFMANYSAQ